jgi:hypothetical protein
VRTHVHKTGIISRNEKGGESGTYEEVLVGKPEGRPLARPRCGWEDKINTYFKGIR